MNKNTVIFETELDPYFKFWLEEDEKEWEEDALMPWEDDVEYEQYKEIWPEDEDPDYAYWLDEVWERD